MIDYQDLTSNFYSKEFVEPIPLKAGDPRVRINEASVKVDFRIISETNYQRLKDRISELESLLPSECVHDWSEVKFCPFRQGDGGKCKQCL